MDKVIMATGKLLNNLSETLGRQYEYEQMHLEAVVAGPNPAVEIRLARRAIAAFDEWPYRLMRLCGRSRLTRGK